MRLQVCNNYLSNCFTSSLNITDFAASDAGMYQCIFTDTDTTKEVVTSIPLRLDTGLCNVCCVDHISLSACT